MRRCASSFHGGAFTLWCPCHFRKIRKNILQAYLAYRYSDFEQGRSVLYALITSLALPEDNIEVPMTDAMRGPSPCSAAYGRWTRDGSCPSSSLLVTCSFASKWHSESSRPSRRPLWCHQSRRCEWQISCYLFMKSNAVLLAEIASLLVSLRSA